MKKTYSIIALLLFSTGFAQIPAGYYNAATRTGYTLKTQLHNIIKGHTDQTYSGLYTTYATSDVDKYYENNGTMLDMYTENPTGAECEFTYGTNQDNGSGGNAECEKYNREHIIPQSVFGSATPMQSDAHFVVPSDKYVNAERGNFPFGVVNTGATFKTYTNGSKRGSNLNSGYSAGYTGTIFEPIDEFKGDIARLFLYFGTRYENVVGGYSYDMFNNTSNQVFTINAINILLTWHNQDPVSQREIDRNNAIYSRQDNRNPYIDHPEYAMQIWGSLLANESFEISKNLNIYPNPSNNHTVNIQTETVLDEIQLININGQLIQQIKKPVFQNSSFTLENLSQGFYFLKLTSGNQSVTKKLIVN